MENACIYQKIVVPLQCQIKEKVMEQLLSELNSILERSEDLGKRMRFEHKICSAELQERLSLGLVGDAAIAHYNDWMKRFGLDYLMVV